MGVGIVTWGSGEGKGWATVKEVTAIVRHERWLATREALSALRVDTLVHHNVQGRGRQRGLKYAMRPSSAGAGDMPFLPKKMFVCVAEDAEVPLLVEAIISVNRTGNPGDGKIFVRPVTAGSFEGHRHGYPRQ
jgi:nitrogen regulatory protein PII 2